MTANLLTLNSTKTEFILIGLPQELAKINTSSLITTHCARHLGFISERELKFRFAICRRPSICRLSSVCLSVTFVRPTQAIEIFGNVSTPFGTLAIV